MRCVATGLLGLALALCWQALVVHCEYHGNWSSLFCTGALFQQPPSLAAEKIYSYPNSRGFDGQFYHYIAHDPFFRGGMLPFIDEPSFRYRRILVPLAAYTLAFGRTEVVDRAYRAVILLFVFIGSHLLLALLSFYGLL